MSKVCIAADKQGNIIGVSSNNPEYGYIRIEQTVRVISATGWLNNVKRSALIKGKVEDLVGCNYKVGEELPGKIVVKESLSPFNPSNPDRDLKIAGASGVICRIDDQPIYRQSFYTPDESAQDELIQHDNTQEIREIQSVSKTLLTLSNETGNMNKPAASL